MDTYDFSYRFPSFMSQDEVNAHATLFRKLADLVSSCRPGDRLIGRLHTGAISIERTATEHITPE